MIVRTTLWPDRDLDVDPAEYADLLRQGLLMPPATPQSAPPPPPPAWRPPEQPVQPAPVEPDQQETTAP